MSVSCFSIGPAVEGPERDPLLPRTVSHTYALLPGRIALEATCEGCVYIAHKRCATMHISGSASEAQR